MLDGPQWTRGAPVHSCVSRVTRPSESCVDASWEAHPPLPAAELNKPPPAPSRPVDNMPSDCAGAGAGAGAPGQRLG